MKKLTAIASGASLTLVPALAHAEAAAEITPGQFAANNVWMMIGAALVFIMHLGFAALEAGLTRARTPSISSSRTRSSSAWAC